MNHYLTYLEKLRKENPIFFTKLKDDYEFLKNINEKMDIEIKSEDEAVDVLHRAIDSWRNGITPTSDMLLLHRWYLNRKIGEKIE